METATAPAIHLPFADRVAAGRAVAERLASYRGQHPVVLGIPRGGVPVAREVALAIQGQLDIIVARKLGAPFAEELAIGAVTADGGRFLNEDVMMAEARRRESRFRGGKAVPVGASDACQAIAKEVDELVCLASPEPFQAVGVHYGHFEPVSESQVEALLRER